VLLTNYSLPIILLGGEFDLMDGPQGLERMINSMTFKGSDDFKKEPRQLWKVDTEKGSVVTGGYIKQKGNLIYITARNAGHFFPRDQFGLSVRVLRALFNNDVHEIPCIDANCDLIKHKCALFGDCNGGLCDKTTGGVCVCKENLFGPDCKTTADKISDDFTFTVKPRETKLYKIDLKKNFILQVFINNFKDHTDKMLVHDLQVSLLPHDKHKLLYNFDQHPMQFNMRNEDNYFFLSENYLDHFIVVYNSNNEHSIKASAKIKDFDFSKSNFWGPGGVGFFFSILMLVAGIVLIIIAYLFYKKYKQNKSYQLLGDNLEGKNSDIKLSNI